MRDGDNELPEEYIHRHPDGDGLSSRYLKRVLWITEWENFRTSRSRLRHRDERGEGRIWLRLSSAGEGAEGAPVTLGLTGKISHDLALLDAWSGRPPVRIIRTETYIDSDTRHVAWGFGAAWVTKPGHIPVPPAPWEFFDEIGPRMARGRPRWRPVGTVAPQTMQRFLPAFVAISLRDLPRPRSIEGYFNIDTSRDAAVEFVLIQPIVIERSPPEWVELLSFLKGASPALLLSAYFVGVRKTSLLVLAKIGAGYILLASAVGLSRWLEDGQFISLLDQFFHR